MTSDGYVAILRTPGTARPLLATLVARVPDSIAALAMVLLVSSTTHSYSSAGAIAAAFAIGTAASAPLAGRAIDRLGQRPVLIALATCFAAALVLLVAVAGQPGWAAAVAAVGGLTRPPLESSLRGLWPRLVPRERLDTAYALDSTAQELIWIGGPLLLAALVSFGRPSLPLFACALLTVLGTAVYATSPAVPARGSRRRTDLAGPLAFRGLRAMLVAGGLYGVATGTLTVALPAAAAGFGHPAGTGLLVAVWGLGSLAGGLAYGSRRWRSPVETRAIATLAAFAVALGLLPLATSFPSLLAAMLLLGLPLSPWLGSLSAAVERAVPASMVVEAFTWSFATITVGIACGTAVGGVLIARAGIGAALEIAAATALAGAALAAVIAPRRP
jgi:predicted MFS family arabinose efflux permease